MFTSISCIVGWAIANYLNALYHCGFKETLIKITRNTPEEVLQTAIGFQYSSMIISCTSCTYPLAYFPSMLEYLLAVLL